MIRTRCCPAVLPALSLSLRTILSFLLVFGTSAPFLAAEELQADVSSSASSIAVTISARVVGRDEAERWNQKEMQVTITGRPVGIRLVGENVAVLARFTPYFRADGTLYIVAQGQVWLELPGEGIRYYTAVETIPVVFGEEVYFLPLGDQKDSPGDRIEILVAAEPYPGKIAPTEQAEPAPSPPDKLPEKG